MSSGPKSTKTATAKAVAQADDEINQIMNEIEELQQEMKTDPAPSKKESARGKLTMVKPEPDAVTDSEVSAAADAGELSDSGEDALAEFRAGSGNDADLDATIGDLSDEGQGGGGLLDQVLEETPTDESAPTGATTEETQMSDGMNADGRDGGADEGGSTETGAGEEGCLTMSLRGKMTLKLHYECGGQEVTVGFAEDCLKVQLADGTEFKVPVARKKLRRIA